jgi:hypothetical protein
VRSAAHRWRIKYKRDTALRRLELFVMPDFKREDRYLVIKKSDLSHVLESFNTAFPAAALRTILEQVQEYRMVRGASPNMECVVVEKDWPEYGPTWAAIEKRMKSEA